MRKSEFANPVQVSLAHCAVGRYGLLFFNDTATTEIYTLSLHDALPILARFHPPHRRSLELRQLRPLAVRHAEHYRLRLQADLRGIEEAARLPPHHLSARRNRHPPPGWLRFLLLCHGPRSHAPGPRPGLRQAGEREVRGEA